MLPAATALLVATSVVVPTAAPVATPEAGPQVGRSGRAVARNMPPPRYPTIALDVPVTVVTDSGRVERLPDSRGRTSLPADVVTPQIPGSSEKAYDLGTPEGVRALGATWNQVRVNPSYPVTRSGTLGPYHLSNHLVPLESDYLRASADPKGCLIVGDSVAYITRTALTRKLKETHGLNCVVDAWPGRPTQGTNASLAHWASIAPLPSTLVLVTGTNDLFTPNAFAHQLKQTMQLTSGVKHLNWVLPWAYRGGEGAAVAAADRTNSMAVATEIRHARLARPDMAAIDWPYVLENRGAAWRAANLRDGVHPSVPGAKAYADLVSAALR